MIGELTPRELIAAFFMLAGSVFFIGSAIGMLRLPDFYARIHASGNAETMGTILAMLGLIVYEGPTLNSAKMAFVFLFVFLCNPIGSHILSKAAYKTGHPVWTLNQQPEIDENVYNEAVHNEPEEEILADMETKELEEALEKARAREKELLEALQKAREAQQEVKEEIKETEGK